MIAATGISIAKAEEAFGVVAAQIDSLRAQLVGLQSAIGDAKSGAITGARRGPQLLDTSTIPGGPFPAGAPVMNTLEGVDELHQLIVGSSPVAALDPDLVRVLARPLHRDAARVIGRPLAQIGDAADAGGVSLAYGLQQVGRLEGYTNIDEAAFAAMHHATRGDARGAVAAVHAADDAGGSRLVLVELDHGLVGASTTPVPLRYRTEQGEHSLIAGVTDSSGTWHDLRDAAAVDAPTASRVSLMPIEQLDEHAIVHYDPKTATKLNELEAARAQVAGLIDALEAATATATARVGESTAARAASMVSAAPGVFTGGERFDAAIASIGRARLGEDRRGVVWDEGDHILVGLGVREMDGVRKTLRSAANEKKVMSKIAPLAQANGYPSLEASLAVKWFNTSAKAGEPLDRLVALFRSGRPLDDFLAAVRVEEIANGLRGARGLQANYVPPAIASTRLDVADISATIQRIGEERLPIQETGNLIDWAIEHRVTSDVIDEIFSEPVRSEFMSKFGTALGPTTTGRLLATAVIARASFADVEIVMRTLNHQDPANMSAQYFTELLAPVVARRMFSESLSK